MSQQGSEERTERATPKREREARERGQLPRSRELSGALLMCAAGSGFYFLGAGLAADGRALLQQGLSWSAADLADPSRLPEHFAALLLLAAKAIAPLLLLCTLVALLAPVLLGGWNFSPQAMLPDFSRLDPIKGLGRLFSQQSLVELLKGLLKAALLVLLALVAASWLGSDLLVLGLEPLPTALAHGLRLCLAAFGLMCAGLLLIAAIDVPWQLWSHAKQLRMTRQETREEHKQSEGRPEVKAKIRRLQQQAASHRMMEQVPGADVIVTNPTHYAVALKYQPGKMRAPRVVAKGADEIARVIRELAERHRVPIVSAPPLARALFRHAELEQEIPVSLYQAVAQVLSYVFQLRQAKSGFWPKPPVIGEVPGGEPGLPS